MIMSEFDATIDLSKMDMPDEDMIKDKPWAIRLLDETQTLTKKMILHWLKVVLDIDPKEDSNVKHVQVLFKSLKKSYEDVLFDVAFIHQTHMDKLANYFDQIDILEKILQLPSSNFEQIFEKNPLIEIEKSVESKIKDYETLLEEKENEIKQLNQRHCSLVTKLGRSPKRLSMTHCSVAVDDFKNQIKKLEEEFSNRETRYREIKANIEVICRDTGMSIHTQLFDNSLNVTDEAMKNMEQCYKEVLESRQKLIEEINTLKPKIEYLWELLLISDEERNAFVTTTEENTLSTLEKLKIEENRLEQLKKDKLPEIKEKQKCRLFDLWELCHCNAEAKNSFPLIYSSQCDEQVCREYVAEIKKWELYYEKHSDILEKIKEYNTLSDKLIQVQLNMSTENLFKNRGATLLTVAKKENILRTRLKAAEKKLLEMSLNYLKSNKKPFLTFGETIENFIGKQIKAQKQYRRKQEIKLPTLFLQNPQNQKTSSTSCSTTPKIPKKGPTKKRTPPLPKFRINQTKGRNSPNLKPYKVIAKTIERSDEDWITASDYSDFEKEVKCKGRSTSFSESTEKK